MSEVEEYIKSLFIDDSGNVRQVQILLPKEKEHRNLWARIYRIILSKEHPDEHPLFYNLTTTIFILIVLYKQQKTGKIMYKDIVKTFNNKNFVLTSLDKGELSGSKLPNISILNCCF